MLKWSVIFFIIAIVAAIFGFTGIESAAVGVAKVLAIIFVVLFLGTLILGATVFKRR